MSSDFTSVERWEDGEFEWENKNCYTVPLKVFFGKVQNLFESVQHLRAELESKGYVPKPESMLLMEVELFKGRLLMEIPKPDQYDASVVEIEKSKVFSTVHKGEFKTIGKTAKKLQQHVESQKGVKPTATYYWDFRHGPEFSGQRTKQFVIFCRL
ncbi:hypothetical protein GF324_07095 [bacterium]|nr:hypothetical protein [bacterium]